ncbi:MAG TPA: ABC transporter permease [Bryobacteraceae bacterium]|nr:ABC transporter permease [Bryobacteraceae bacterium]
MKWFEDISQDARFALRMARRNAGFTVVAVITLALAIGSTTAIFSAVQTVLLDPLPYRDPGRVVSLSETDPGVTGQDGASAWTAGQWRTRARSFESISLYGDGARILVENGEAEVLRGSRVNYDFFETLGVNMMLGRSFHAEEDRWPRANVVILTYGLWRRRFGGDPHIIGRVLEFSEEKYRVIGVLPRDFYPLRMSNPAEKPVIFMPLGYDPVQAAACRTCFGGNAIGRLKPGVRPGQARAELNGIMGELARQYPSDYPRDPSVFVEPLRDRLIGPVQNALWVLLAAVSLVLLIACANTANLLLARATARTREIAVRAALGVGRWRLVRQLLTESLLLSAAGGVAGVLLAWRAIPLLTSLAPKELPRFDEVRMDATVLLFGIAVSLGTGVLFGILPALRASRLDLNGAFKGTASSGANQRSASRRLLVSAEVALAFLLAVGTGLLAKSFLRLTAVDPGFDPRNILTLTPTVTGARYATLDAKLRYYRDVVEKVKAVPGILSAAMISNVPMSHTEPAKFRIQGAPDLTDADAPSADVFWASPEYFRVVKIPLKRGRFFTNEDGVNQPPVAIVSESLARSRFPGSQPLGERIRLGPQQENGPWFTIVGIVGDVRQSGFDHEPDEAVYLPQAVEADHYTRLLARTAGEPMNFERAVLAAIRNVDPLQPVFHVQPMDDYVASYLAARSFTLTLIGLFATMALLLAAVGVYGVVSYMVSLRTREVGIRMALGAERGAVLRMIIADVLVLLTWGLLGGLLSQFVLARFLSGLLFHVHPNDLATLAGVALVLAFLALLAGYIPALRAARVDPTAALRSD